MAIALPPPSTPALADVEIVRAGGSEIVSLAWQQNQIHVIGAELIDKTRIEEAITTATTLSDVVRQIQAVYYVAGYPAVQVSYARAEPDLFVLVTPGKITRVEAEEPYAKYFAGLAGADPLTDHSLEPARTLASVHADRKGEDPSIEFVPEDGGAALVLKGSETGPWPGKAGAEFGNPGNRFSGRHLVSYYASAGLPSGDELRFEGRNALTGLGKESSESRGYHEFVTGWNRVTTLGLFGLRARYTGYQQEFDTNAIPVLGPTIRFTGKIQQFEAAWFYPLTASFNSRWNLSLKGDYTKKTYEETTTDTKVQIQEYGSAEVGTDYAHVYLLGDQRVDFSAGLSVRKGLGSDETDNALKAADLGYLLVRPTINVGLPLGESFLVGLGLAAQVSSDTLPEQQQWVMGGVGNVETFLPGVAAGDSGGLARLFAQQPFEVGGLQVTPRVFVEYGYAKFEDPLAGQTGATQSVADGGVSLSVKPTRWSEVKLSYAESFQDKKISQAAQDDSDANMYFSVGVNLP